MTISNFSIAQMAEPADTLKSCCAGSSKASNASQELSCSLSSSELLKRKETVLKSLKEAMLEKKELHNGYAFRFPGTDRIVDEIAEFIKTERSCCSFFVFSFSVSGDQSEAWLELTGPEGSKDFITEEMDW